MLTQDDHAAELEKQLSQANKQLLQSEKLATIGQLAAGVAHEINNPIGYIHSNLKTLRTYLLDLFGVMDAIDQADSLATLKSRREEVEYDFLKSDIHDLLGESLEGIARIEKIIAALKDFSRKDDDGFKPDDLHQGIQSTLNVVSNELKYRAQVNLSLGQVPLLECNLPQINQVIMNLLVNAAHAMEHFGRIDIRTGTTDTGVWFEVEDNGAGIDPDHLQHLFDPFFTTKPVGKGTGLGLALSKNIIDKHRGTIEVRSQPGQGTCFRVCLPIQQPEGEDD
ncbi:sensor histidine kinase [Marinobacter sp. SS21]|uniref:sensor histidine kinase n=1 Tax=Marinobacter sp. SS21 TaxID=2979460 RepID=UPI00232DAA7B|nr:ATP-binding protein [Marinobacter sp. SS21]MDC0663775.1 ATP-binding protein [Marinobacter sp. SS21]